MNSAFVHCLWTHKYHILSTFSLKIGLTILFTHLKIILLQYFSVFSFQLYSNGQLVSTKKLIKESMLPITVAFNLRLHVTKALKNITVS